MAVHVKTQNTIKDLAPYDRPRERLKNMGIDALTTVELLALILGSGSKNGSVLENALAITTTFVPKELARVTLQSLQTVPGVGAVGAGKILASIELGKRLSQPSTKITINTPQKVLDCVQDIRSKRKEYAIALYLNGRQELIKKEIISIGGLNFNMLEARDLFAPALTLPAPFVILVHNHPSGNTTASKDDISTTKRLTEAGLLLGIEIIDHVIVSAEGYFSFREGGITST